MTDQEILARMMELVEVVQGPKWHRPDVGPKGERGEISRTNRSLKIPSNKMKAALKTARIGTLSDKHWSNLQNTWSYKIKRKEHEQYAGEIGRNTKRLDKGFKEGHKMPVPIVLHRKGKKPYLIAGNTRLSAASVHKIQPKVLHVRLK